MLLRSRTWTEVTLVSSWGERRDDEEVEEDEGEKDGDRDDDDDDDDEDVDLRMVVRTWTEVTLVSGWGDCKVTQNPMCKQQTTTTPWAGYQAGGQESSLIYPIISRGANVTFEGEWFL